MTQKEQLLKLNKIEKEYILGLVENDLETYPYDTETFLVFNLLYEKLLKLN